MTEAVISQSRSGQLERLVEHPWFKGGIMVLIALSAVLLGLETARELPSGFARFLVISNQLIVAIFVVELVLRIAVYRFSFFRESWNIFDFAIVAAALIAPTGPFQVVRSLRILRAFRLVSSVPSLRRVVEGLFGAVPGIASVLLLLLLVLYIAAVMATVLFRDVAPNEFGHLGISLFSLFQIMTLEGWSEIATRVMEQYPWSWVYFIGYILVATFLVLNLVIGVVVSSIQSRIEAESRAHEDASDSEIKDEIMALREEIRFLRQELRQRSTD